MHIFIYILSQGGTMDASLNAAREAYKKGKYELGIVTHYNIFKLNRFNNRTINRCHNM